MPEEDVVIANLAASFQASFGLGITLDEAQCDAARHGIILS